ncbi:hypothetical protein JGH11_02345 [Dysgonomonas sp. Marseille-P4677]|uniref:hypothetical protein n=1 Tax=Dysgonomonas sp. Marseille-P4677 TaxID=2364790 RepID=UPI001913FC07|nr:hypothetical protein [Dysgonomonas sp. Marseille-P4677]MBK5719706.1 hypothetical protein [Dysgonomonas sp. Marseille-P4677]
MDTQELSKRYMEKYNELTLSFEKLKINNLVNNLNEAISKSDMTMVNQLYNKVLEWNSKVEQLEGVKIAIDSQFHHLHLPSPALFAITFDGEEKVWKFSTGAD